MTASGPAISLAVFMTASSHGGGRCSPLSASGMGSMAGKPGVRCGRVWECLLSPSLSLSLKCGCSVSSLCGECCYLISACSYLERSYYGVAAVASASGARVCLCPAALDDDSTTWVLLRLASAPPCRFHAQFAGRRLRWGSVWRLIRSFVARPLVVPSLSAGVLWPSVGPRFALLSGY